MSNIDTSSWKEFKIIDVFGPCKLGKYHNPEFLKKDDDGYPYICASNQNNGINKEMPRVSGDNLAPTKGNIISWGKQCPMFSYHDEPCVTAQGMYYIELPDDVEEPAALFLCSALTNACKGKFSYGNCLIGSKMDEIAIKLPVKETLEIDWNFMEKYIMAIEKLVIKDVIEWKDKELAKTKEIVREK